MRPSTTPRDRGPVNRATPRLRTASVGYVKEGMGDDQLSRHERRILEALETGLGADDPAFVERFAIDAQELDKPHRPRWSPPLLWWLARRRPRPRGGA